MQMQMFVRNRGINKCALCENVCMCVCPCRVVVAGFGKKLLWENPMWVMGGRKLRKLLIIDVMHF